MFPVEKHFVRIKAREYTDGSKQRRRPAYKEEDAAYPTVSNEEVRITCAIEAHKNCNVASINIPGAYLMHSQMKKSSCF